MLYFYTLKKTASTFLVYAAFITAVVGALALCAWLGYSVLNSYLSSPHTYGDVEFVPYGHTQESFLTHKFDSVAVTKGDNKFVVRDAYFDLTVLSDSKGLTLSAGNVDIHLQPDSTAPPEQPDTSNTIPTFPEKAKFYLPVKVDVQSLSISLDSTKSWKAEDISIKSQSVTAAHIKARNIQGNYLAEPADLDIHTDFTHSSVKVDGSIRAGNDSIEVNVESPKDNLLALKTSLNLAVKDPEKWIPVEIPDAVPPIGKLSVSGSASINPKTKKPKYDVTIKTRIGEFWPLKDLNVNLHVTGDDKKFHPIIHLVDDEGGTIHVEADLDTKLDGTATGYTKDLSAEFGPQMMPMDLTIHSAEKTGNIIKASVETRQGSLVEATVDLDEGKVTYTGDMSPLEPWALDWSRGRLVLNKRFKIFGVVEDGHTRILVKIPDVPYAYQMKADSLQTVLLIDKNGIDFSDGIIYTPKEIYDFTGDVVWEKTKPHTSWKVKQRNGGYAEAYISIMDSLSLDIKSDEVEISTLPFSKIKVNEKLTGKVSGHWFQNFDKNVGEAEVSLVGNFDPFSMEANIKVHENGDTIFIEKAEAIQNKNKVEAEAVFILPNDSNPDFKPMSPLPIQIVHAWISAKDFSIPLLLEPINDTTFTSGFISGDLAFNENVGLQGNVDFTDLKFSNIPSHIFNVKKMNLFAEASKAELNAYLGIGGGGWTGNTQIILDDIFKSKRHVSISHNSDNGGNLWAEGFIDSTLTFAGKVNMNGSWFVPGTSSEVTRTDLEVDVTARIREGLKGIVADLRTDSTLYQPPKMEQLFPLRARGHLENGILNITEASTHNDSGETITASLQFDINNSQLQAIDLATKKFSFRTDAHTIVVEDISGHMEDSEDELTISANIPVIKYLFHDESFGDAQALAHSNLKLSIPHSREGLLQNKTVSGDFVVDKLVYKKNLEIEVTPSSMDKFITMFNNAIAKLRKTETQEAKLSTASPINLSVHVSDSQRDSIQIITPFATFPFTFDVWVLGNTSRPLLRGDISNSNSGFIGVQDIYEFDLNSFRISWSDVPWQHGVIDVTSSQELPYCTETDDNINETCPINFDILGTLVNPQPTPRSNCGNESSAAAIYYNIFLGCIAENTDESTDWNKLAGKAIGKVLSSTANKTLGGEYIGDIDMKVMLFNSNTSSEKDSSYFKMPISLDKWVKDLSLILGYTQDQSENPTYDQALQFGVNYKLPVFKEKEYSHKNHLNPTLSLNGLLISKQYLTNTGTEGNESRIEKNIGINYTYHHWNPCLLSVGKCETNYANSKKQEKKTEVKK